MVGTIGFEGLESKRFCWAFSQLLAAAISLPSRRLNSHTRYAFNCPRSSRRAWLHFARALAPFQGHRLHTKTARVETAKGKHQKGHVTALSETGAPFKPATERPKTDGAKRALSVRAMALPPFRRPFPRVLGAAQENTEQSRRTRLSAPMWKRNESRGRAENGGGDRCVFLCAVLVSLARLEKPASRFERDARLSAAARRKAGKGPQGKRLRFLHPFPKLCPPGFKPSPVFDSPGVTLPA